MKTQPKKTQRSTEKKNEQLREQKNIPRKNEEGFDSKESQSSKVHRKQNR